jgi:cytochrome c553
MRNSEKKLIKNLVITSSLTLLTLLSACSDSKEKSSERHSEAVSTDTTPKIEIVQNKDARAIKVAQKDDGKTEGNSFYYDYGEKEKKTKKRTDLDANMNVRSPYEEVQVSMLVKKLSKNFIVRCSPCHNDYANGIIGPSLLERDSDFIYNRIQDFKTGKKSNPLMTDLIKMMSDKQIRSMADEIYAFNKEIKKMRNK